MGRDEPAFRRVLAMQFMPEGTVEQWDAFDELQRVTTSPGNAVRFIRHSTLSTSGTQRPR
jgi:hypothetical protein